MTEAHRPSEDRDVVESSKTLVSRLRLAANLQIGNYAPMPLANDAADELERLQRMLAADIEMLRERNGIIDRLRAALEQMPCGDCENAGVVCCRDDTKDPAMWAEPCPYCEQRKSALAGMPADGPAATIGLRINEAARAKLKRNMERADEIPETVQATMATPEAGTVTGLTAMVNDIDAVLRKYGYEPQGGPSEETEASRE